MELQRIYVFLALFTFVYFLESIGGMYMVASVQNIERQFRIPSKLSGFLVSAHDISYVLTVVFVSFYGSKGNRAKWIGFGTFLIAFAHIFTAMSNFLFRADTYQLNLAEVEARLRPDPNLFAENATIPAFFDYAPIRDRIPARVREMIHSALEQPPGWLVAAYSPKRIQYNNSSYTQSQFLLDEPLILEILQRSDQLLSAIELTATNLSTANGGTFKMDEHQQNAKQALAEALRHFVRNRKELPEADLKTMRRSAVAAFSFCNKLVNNFRGLLQDAKCQREISNVGPLLIIFCAMLVLGLGRTMPWALGIPLVDDNIKRHKVPMYFAIINFFKIMGPTFGFLIAAAVNKIYYTFPAPAPRGLTPQDPTWIGAWWIGFLFIGFMQIGPSITLFFFPESSSKKKKCQQKSLEANGGGGGTANGHNLKIGGMPTATVVSSRKERTKLTLYDRHVRAESCTTEPGLFAFLRSYSAVLSSKVYVGASIARVLDIFAFKGYFVFLPKFLENHYGIPQYRVHLFIAAFGVLGFALGTASGGLIMRKLRLNGRRAAYYVLIASSLNTGLFMAKSMLGCHSVVNSVGRVGIANGFNFTRECNIACGCDDDTTKLYPVCDTAGNAYYSPCHAGCRHAEAYGEDKLRFSECECVSGGAGSVSRELCRDECVPMRNAFFVLVFVGAFVGGTAVVPGMLLLLRSVPPQSRSPALGLQGLLVSGIGTLPSPVIWGWLVDSACLVWDNDCEKGSCQFYDPRLLRLYMHWLYIVIRGLSLIADIYVCIYAKGLNLQEDVQEEDTGSNSNTTTAKSTNISLENIRPPRRELAPKI